MPTNFKAISGVLASLLLVGALPTEMLNPAKADYLRSADNMAKCLGVPNGSNGAPLVIEDCQLGNSRSQQWTYDNRSGQISSNGYPGKCLHKSAGGWANGNRIHLWDCGAGTNEMKSWRFDTSTGAISARENGNVCFHSQAGGWVDGTATQLWADCRSNSSNRKWRITSYDQTDCSVFDTLLRPNTARIRDMINAYLPFEREISSRKTLITESVRNVATDGCSASIAVNATVERKIRRDADGWISLKAQLHSMSANYLCVRDPSVGSVHLDNLGLIGENFYRRRGTKGLPDEMCIAF